jgi:hypothetical protein
MHSILGTVDAAESAVALAVAVAECAVEAIADDGEFAVDNEVRDGTADEVDASAEAALPLV